MALRNDVTIKDLKIKTVANGYIVSWEYGIEQIEIYQDLNEAVLRIRHLLSTEEQRKDFKETLKEQYIHDS